ncbi:DUF4126 domain-containing protein [Dokdonella sp.]|uniref:DUF4126 domain-containing protein n=1 Tax=Dokdonella sp. TaxID=2291710 RepID=UPI0025C3D13A|nr:DUF4126 domain-containing protein [Dokdonella sp.]MBX3688001.1 DUF4126 domain-containing protein [Dokdonella sp.]
MSGLSELALTGALAWASGIRLYATLLIVGLLGHFGYLDLPPALEVLQHPWVLTAAAVMTVGEFVADKVPAFDSFWDALHTFIRIPAGAFLAWGAMGDATPAAQVAAAILGGLITGGTHLAKGGTRALLNTSPEPFSNWTASASEDGIVLAGLWLALAHPLVFLICLLLFLLLLAWALPKLWRFIARVTRRLLGRRASVAGS